MKKMKELKALITDFTRFMVEILKQERRTALN
jgi:hypothetical protein